MLMDGQVSRMKGRCILIQKKEKLNAIQKTNVASHELGHHLGLGHNQGQNQLSSIMYWKASVYSTLILLSQDDKDSYDDAYDNKY